MSTPTATFNVSKAAFLNLVKLAQWTRLEEFHLHQGLLMAKLAWRGVSPEDCPRVVADLSHEVGKNFDLHVPGKDLIRCGKMLKWEPAATLRLEVGNRYTLRNLDQLFLKRLPSPTEVLAPLNTGDKQRIASLTLTDDAVKGFKARRPDIDLFVRNQCVEKLLVVDPEPLPGMDPYLRESCLIGNESQAADVAEAELLLRARVFLPRWLAGRKGLQCTVWLLPHEQPSYWLMTTLPLGASTVIFQEPLTLVGEQCRQRGEAEIDRELAQLAAG